MIELCAITDNPGPPLPDVGPLHLVPVDGLAAVCTAANGGEATPEALWRREDIIEALMSDRDLLPVRYGTRLEDEAAVARAVEERHDELAAALDRVRGAIELSVRVAARGTPPSAPVAGDAASGAEYLRVRAHAEATHERTARRLREPLSALARSNIEWRPRPPELFRAAYLVERDGVERFTAEVARLQDASPDLSILCTGPWPPYSFVER